MAPRGKRYLDAVQRYDRQHLYTPLEAVELVKALSKARFDETIELAVRLGVDPRRADQIVRGSLTLPAGTGKTKRVAVFAAGDAAAEARAEGADVIGADDLVTRIEKEGFLEFDVAIATPDLMAQVGKLGRLLGPRGLMPNPKTGTVTEDTAKAIKEVKAGRVEFKLDKNGNVAVGVGKVSFTEQALAENGAAVIEAVVKARPPSAKGTFVENLTLAATMFPGIRIDTAPYLKL
jgi:large subunit ribosomal protein L1